MKRQEIAYKEKLDETIDQLSKGAFLTVKANDEINTMTIAWGMVGYIWKKPVFQVLVRKSRHTYDMIEASEDFTVSLPIDVDLQEALKFCGTKSGREYDKFAECQLTAVPSMKVKSPIIGECTLHYECKIVAKQILDADDLLNQDVEGCYTTGDYHTMYYGEIVACYITK